MSNIFLAGMTMLLLSFIFELIIYISGYCWKHKKIISFLTITLVIISTILIIYNHLLNVIALVFLLSAPYRLINLSRLTTSKINDLYLYNIGSRSFAHLGSIQFLIVGFLALTESSRMEITTIKLLPGLFIVFIVIISIVIAVTTTKNVLKTKARLAPIIPNSELPTVTVAIAARNETPSLQSCLDSVLADDYPKLEIIIYDDESQDDTLGIIKQFAHDGARFIQGKEIPEKWLAKNFAYQSLLDESTGEIVMFLGTDVRLHKDSIRKTVEIMMAKQVDMMSIMPKRTKEGILAALIQPMRYWWELAVPRAKNSRPPVLSTVWLVKRESLLAEGGFSSYKRAIIPEEHLAKLFNNVGKYAFVRTNDTLKISSHKKFFEQWNTAIRTRYPQVHRRPELVYLRTLMLAILWLPFIILPVILVTYPFHLVTSLLLITAIFLLYSHVLISYYTNPISGLIAPFNFPLILLLEIIALNISKYRYEYSSVVWKKRNVSEKAMYVYPSLPKID